LMFVELVDVLPVVLAALSDVVLAALPVDRFVEPEAALPEVALLPVPEVAALPVRSVEPVAALPEAEPLPVVELPPEVVFAALPVRSVLLDALPLEVAFAPPLCELDDDIPPDVPAAPEPPAAPEEPDPLGDMTAPPEAPEEEPEEPPELPPAPPPVWATAARLREKAAAATVVNKVTRMTNLQNIMPAKSLAVLDNEA
jgi:hypothetical protein